VNVGIPPWALAALVVLLGSTVAGGAWFLTRASRREVEAARAKSEFLAGVTHELKTPLTSIRLYGEMLEEGRVAEASKRQEYIRTIGREAQRLTELIDRVLTLARLERGEAPPRTLRVTAGEVARDAEGAFRPAAENVGIRFLVNVEGGDAPLAADGVALVQALVDLLENARKYAAAGGQVELAGRREESHFCFEVADRGPGLPPGDPERLFAMFARGEDDSASGKVGLGIGLALARRIVEAQGGALTAGNRDGGGAVFRIRLPIADA
jgi:signal transduction histidine kinase